MLFHKDVLFTPQMKSLKISGKLYHTLHATNAAKNDVRGIINIPKTFNSDEAVLVECETINGVIVKTVWRQYYDENNDIVLVITNEMRVKTVWLNSKTDSHETLDKSKYYPYTQ